VLLAGRLRLKRH